MLFPVTLNDLSYPKPPLFFTFYIAFYIFVVGGDRDFKFGR